MVRVDAYAREYENQPDFMQQVADYLTRVASAVVSVFKRILCVEDTFTVQDLKWNSEKCRRLERENRQLNQSIGDLQCRVVRLKQCESSPSTLQKFLIEATLFFCLCPLYIMSLPVMLIRDALYEGLQKNYA